MTKRTFTRWPFCTLSSSEQLSFLKLNLTGLGYLLGLSTSLPTMNSRLVKPLAKVCTGNTSSTTPVYSNT